MVSDSRLSLCFVAAPFRPTILLSFGDVESLNQGPVRITIGQNLLTLIESELSVICPVNGLPTAIITWRKGNETLPSDGRMAIRNGTLFIAELEVSDTGTYTCFAENSKGNATVSSNVTVAGGRASAY